MEKYTADPCSLWIVDLKNVVVYGLWTSRPRNMLEVDNARNLQKKMAENNKMISFLNDLKI